MGSVCENWTTWLKKTRFSHLNEAQAAQTLNWLVALRDTLIKFSDIKTGDKIIDLGCGSGLIGFGILELFQDNVELIFSDKFQDCLDECQNLLSGLNIKSNASFLKSDVCDIKLPDNTLDKALTRSVLVHVLDKQLAMNEIYRILKPGGVYCAFEPIIRSNTRYSEILSPEDVTDWQDFKNAEDEFMTSPDDPLVNFDADSLAKNIDIAGFSDGNINIEVTKSSYTVSEATVENWFTAPPSPDRPCVKDRFLKYFDENKVNNYIKECKRALNGKMVFVKSDTAFIKVVK